MLMRPKDTFVSIVDGQEAILTRADLLDSQNPHVKARPDLFEEARATFGIEQATANPGEGRNVHRGR